MVNTLKNTTLILSHNSNLKIKVAKMAKNNISLNLLVNAAILNMDNVDYPVKIQNKVIHHLSDGGG